MAARRTRSRDKRQDRAFEMPAGRVEWRRIAHAVLQVDRRRHAHHLWNFVIADAAAEVVGALDVEIDRHIHRLTNGGNLRKREVNGQVERRGAKVFEEPRRRGIGRGERD